MAGGHPGRQLEYPSEKTHIFVGVEGEMFYKTVRFIFVDKKELF